jgi:hypothetical protein
MERPRVLRVLPTSSRDDMLCCTVRYRTLHAMQKIELSDCIRCQPLPTRP